MKLMEGSIEEATKDLRAWTVRVEPSEARPLLERMSSLADGETRDVLVAKADMVFGVDHLRSALYHAKKAIAEGTNASDTLPMETLLYASGERQINNAIKKMSVRDETTEIIVAVLRGRVNPEEGWVELPDVLAQSSVDRLNRFGITTEELRTFAGPLEELVLERVAAVDVLKR
jgi:KEOPS complex subunit Cgi121